MATGRVCVLSKIDGVLSMHLQIILDSHLPPERESLETNQALSQYYSLYSSVVRNAAARVLTFSHKHEHVSPILRKLHWLPIEQRIQYKILLLTFKILNNCAPSYLSDLLKAYKPTRILTSSGLNLLSKPSYNLNSYGKRAFSCAAPELWNSLPQNIRSCASLSISKAY